VRVDERPRDRDELRRRVGNRVGRTARERQRRTGRDDAAGRPIAGSSATVGAPGAPPGSGGGSTSGAAVLPRGTGTIKIGFHYSSDIAAAYAAFGAEGEFVDVEETVNKIVAWVNARGGLGGKKIQVVYHGTNPLSGSFPQQVEAACTFFAEDAKVAVVISTAIMPDDTMPACFARKSLPLVWSYQYLLPRGTFDKYPNTLYMPHNIGTDRMGFYADALKAAGFFEKGARFGIVRYDTAVHKDFADRIIRAGLAKYGLKVTDEAALTKPQSAGEAGTTANQAAGAMVRFKNAGINHILWVPSGGAIPLVWAPSADTQKYFPRSAFTSLDIPNFIEDNMSSDQLKRALVVGWMPPNDTHGKYLPKPKQYQDCKQASGIPDDLSGGAQACDGFFFLKAAWDKTPTYGVAGLRKAVESLGTGFASPWTISTLLKAGRHDGATSYRILQFNPECVCFTYVSGPKKIS
jgi:ABC-type branched-subunit amino acid transport system substrate-binding protein